MISRFFCDILKFRYFNRNSYLRCYSRKKVQMGLTSVANYLEKINVTLNPNWASLRNDILQQEINKGHYSEHNIDAVILNYCLTNNKKLGLSYIDFLDKENIKKNLATVGKYLQLLYYKNEHHLLNGRKCPDSEEKIILDCYKSLENDYPVLDAQTLESVLLVLSLTHYWKECLEILKEIEKSSVPSIKSYSVIAGAAFLNNEPDLAWKLLEKMFLNEKIPISLPFLTYISLTKKSQNSKAMLENLLLFFQKYDYVCTEDVILSLSQLEKVMDMQSCLVNITKNGFCKHCHHSLHKYELSTEEFEELKRNFLENVIIGRDVFLKSNPEELRLFKQFIDKMEQFDVVIDGLNVAYSAGAQPPAILSAMVAAVVSYFSQQNKKVLVFGRKHMNQWPKKNWKYVLQNSTVFLTQDISQDDPYLLYCALTSGENTIIVTKDLMRGHKYRLKSPKHKLLFSRWLSQRQYQIIRINALGRPIFRFPSPFRVTAQKNNVSWHIPYCKNEDNDNNEYHKTWFCIKWEYNSF